MHAQVAAPMKLAVNLEILGHPVGMGLKDQQVRGALEHCVEQLFGDPIAKLLGQKRLGRARREKRRTFPGTSLPTAALGRHAAGKNRRRSFGLRETSPTDAPGLHRGCAARSSPPRTERSPRSSRGKAAPNGDVTVFRNPVVRVKMLRISVTASSIAATAIPDVARAAPEWCSSFPRRPRPTGSQADARTGVDLTSAGRAS